MRWLLVYFCVGAVAGIELLCDSPLCTVLRPDYKTRQKFNVEGNTVEVNHTESYFYLNCNGVNTLDSLGMPHFASEFLVSTVVLAECPLPTTRNSSLLNTLTALNVTLKPTSNGETYFKMLDFPGKPQLAPQHFAGLEHLTNLTIKSYDSKPEPPAGFFAGFHNLRSLQLYGVKLPDGELNRLPSTLKALDLTGVSVAILSETLQAAVSEVSKALPDLKILMLENRFSAVEVTNSVTINKTVSNLQNNASSSLESVYLYFWTEARLAALVQCDNLRKIAISKSQVRYLPDRFVAACLRLEELAITDSLGLQELPAKFLEGANALKRLSLRSCDIKSFPEGLFQRAPNLVELDLSGNSILELPSDVFAGLQLRSLSLRNSDFINNTQLNSLAGLTTLTELNVAGSNVRDLCEYNGYSQLRNLTQLKKLDLSYNDITHICRDWREDFVFLEMLNLNSDRIRQITFADFQYTRDTSVKKMVVNLGHWITRVKFTEDDYKNALTAPASVVTLKFKKNYIFDYSMNMDCDCTLYWLRRAMIDASHAIKIDDLTCTDNRPFKDLKPEEICPEHASTMTTAKP